jgi:imidazolonepropionase
MKRSILVRGARQLLTLHGPTGPRRGAAMRELGVIEDGSLLISDGVITNVGPTRRIENLAEARSAEEINATGRVVMPGFVDSHTHLVSAPGRNLQFKMGFHGERPGPADTFLPNLQYVRSASANLLESQAKRYLEACLRHGTTILEAKSGYALSVTGEIKMLRVFANLGERYVSLVPTFLGAGGVPPEFEGQPDVYLQWLCAELLPKVAERRLARFADCNCDPLTFSPDQARPYLELAKRSGLVPKLQAEQSSRMGAVRVALEVQAASVDGLNHANSTDADLLARSNTIATLLPAKVHQGLYSRLPPARELIDAGAAVALATAFHPAAGSTYNMQMVISLACTHMGITPEEAITACTINGAHAVRRADQSGTLEFGKEADLLILNVADYREIPYHFGGNIVSLTMRKGEVVYREGAVMCAV